MKKYLLLILFFISFSALGKTSTENFESESNGSTSFTANGIVLNTWTTGKVIHIVSIAPTDISLSSTSIYENVPWGSVVGNLSSIDSDAGSTFTYTLVSGVGSADNAAFLIAGSNLQIIQSPDFETKSSYSIRIKTTSLGGLSFEKIFTITVDDVCELSNGVSQLDGVLTANQPGAAYQWIKCPATILVGENGQSYIPTEVGTSYAVVITVGSCSTLSSCILVNDLYSPDPSITSAKYNAVTGALVVTGKNLLSLPGANNDIVSNKFRITGQGNSSYTLTNTPNVDITDANTFTLILSITDKTAVSNILNKNGTNAVGGTVYNLMALEDWNAGAPAITNIADLTGNGITVSNLITPAANILYVNKSITGGNGSGDSWANALAELADALKWANENKSNWTNASPLNIYVAKGTYKPLYTPEDGKNFSATPVDPRDKAFLMVNNVKLYGGFAGTESTLTQRDLTLTANKSTLSGDFNGNDGANFAGNTENAYHVVISVGTVGVAELNGFTISGGNANSSTTFSVNGYAVWCYYGGGMVNYLSFPTISQTSFSGNISTNWGGGVYNYLSSPIISQSSFLGNNASYGGGMFNDVSSPKLINVSLANNKATDAGGLGGGIYYSAISGGSIINSILYGNITPNNTSDANREEIYSANTSATKVSINNSIVKDFTSGGTINVIATNIITDNPLFNPGNLTLQAGSPAINAGSNIDYTNAGGNLATDKDLAGNPRLTGTTIDLGAYEALTQSQTINPIANITKTYGDASFEQGATATSGLIVSYASADNNIAEAYQDATDGNKWKINIKKAGTVNITAKQAGDVTYDPAVDVVFNLTINKKPVTIALTSGLISKIYDGNTNAIISVANLAFATGDVISGDQLNIALSSTAASYATADGGTAKAVTVSLNNISLSGTSLANYEIANTADVTANIGEITKAVITGITFVDGSFTYDGTAKSLAITGTLPAGVTVSYTGNGQTAAGVYTVTATINGGGNYEDQTLTAQLTINKTAIAGISFAGASFDYDGTAKSLAITGTLPAGVTVSYTGNAQTNAGTYTVTANINGGEGYEDQTLAAQLTINKIAIKGVSFTGGIFDYDGTAKSLAITGTLPAGVTVTYTNNAQVNARTYTVTANINGGVNYQNQTLTAQLSINKAMLIITANNALMCQGSSIPVFTASYAGFKNGETESSLTSKPSLSTTASSSSAAGTYAITASGAVSGNYNITYVNGTLSINALPVVAITSNNGNSISKGETIQLTATGGTNYVWTGEGIISGENSAVLTARPTQGGIYTVRVTNASGCSSEQTFVLTVREDFATLKATNILTPNGDGINDVWLVENIDMYPNNEVKIFDRASRILYSKRGYDNSWNGMLSGNPLAEGTYYYIIDFGTGKPKQKGFITLLRGR